MGLLTVLWIPPHRKKANKILGVFFFGTSALFWKREKKIRRPALFSCKSIIFPVKFLAALKEDIFEMLQLLIHQEMENRNIPKKFYLLGLFLEAYLMHVMSVHMKYESHLKKCIVIGSFSQIYRNTFQRSMMYQRL